MRLLVNLCCLGCLVWFGCDVSSGGELGFVDFNNLFELMFFCDGVEFRVAVESDLVLFICIRLLVVGVLDPV